jgi:O-antigen ligase
MLPVGIAAALAYLLLVPEQFNPTIADIYLSPFRVFLLIATLYLLFGALRRRLRFTWPDLLVVLASAWIWLASYMTTGSVSVAMVMGGSHTVDIALAYFLARLTIQTPTDFRLFLILIAPGLAFVSTIIVIESLTHTLIMQPLASALTGLPNRIRADVRLGLLRGAGPFAHPIHAGIFLGSFLPLYLLSGLRGWPRIVGCAASLGGAFSMSSAAMLSLVVGGMLSMYDWLTERIANLTWRIFLLLTALLYVGVELTSNTGFYGLLVRYASLNAASAYNRVLIWQYGTENIGRHPWFGIGYGDWDRPEWMVSSSFDHFWLLMALRWGIPEVVFLLGATIAAIAALALRSRLMPGLDGRLVRGIAISLAVFALGVNSVSLWLNTLVWFFMLLGVAVSLGMQFHPPVPTPMQYGK